MDAHIFFNPPHRSSTDKYHSCAAKHKSSKALPKDRQLFIRLSDARIRTTDEITTNLVLKMRTDTIRVPSDRTTIHYDASESDINIYIPYDPHRRQICYRSQLPELLTSILGVGQAATFDVATIITSSMEEIDDILIAHDIPHVGWIKKPIVFIPEDARPNTPESVDSSNDSTSMVLSTALGTPNATPERYGRAVPVHVFEDDEETIRSGRYASFIQRIVRSARQAGQEHIDGAGEEVEEEEREEEEEEEEMDSDSGASSDEEYGDFKHREIFGARSNNAFVHNRRIGAAGEAFVNLILSVFSPAY